MSDQADVLRNPKDPLRKSGPEGELELFKAFGKVAHGYTSNLVIGAALNVIINAIRQEHATAYRAAKAYDDITGRAKHLLMEKHYDNAGNRRNVFPYMQMIEPDFVDGRSDWQKGKI